MAGPPHLKLLNKSVGDNIPIIHPQLCEPFCNVILNPTGICPSTCLSFCNLTCRIPLIPEIPPPQPPPAAIITHGTKSNKPRGLTVFFTISVFILVITFLFIIYKLYSRRRSSEQQQPEHEEEPEHEGSGSGSGPGPIEHHVWLIRTIGVEQSVISGITVVKYKKGDGFVEGTYCSVCLSEFQENDSLRLLPKCNHAFHVPCIDTWLRSHTNCPVCRAGIVKNAELILPPSQEEVIVQNLVGVSDSSSSSSSSSSRREITSEFGNTELNIIEIPESAMKNDENHREEGYK